MKSLEILKTMLSEQEAIVGMCKADRSVVIDHGHGRVSGGVITPREVDTYPKIDVLKGAIRRIERG